MTVVDTRARTGAIAGVNPVAKLGVSALIAVPLILTLDPVSASVALALEFVLFLFAGLGCRDAVASQLRQYRFDHCTLLFQRSHVTEQDVELERTDVQTFLLRGDVRSPGRSTRPEKRTPDDAATSPQTDGD